MFNKSQKHKTNNSSVVQVFNSPQFGKIRTIEVGGQPYFVGIDVATALGYSKIREAISAHVDEDDSVKQGVTDSLGRVQQTTLINESGMYSLIFGSKLPTAKAFKKWVTSEVLPSIRRTGGYTIENSGATTSHPATVKAKIAAAKFLASFLNLNESSKLLIAKSIADPLGLPTPDYTPSHGVLKSASELLKENGYTMSAQAFNAKLMELGYLTELTRPSSKGGVKKFKSITAKGLEYGENQVNPNNPKSTQPLWYADRFNEFMNVIK